MQPWTLIQLQAFIYSDWWKAFDQVKGRRDRKVYVNVRNCVPSLSFAVGQRGFILMWVEDYIPLIPIYISCGNLLYS